MQIIFGRTVVLASALLTLFACKGADSVPSYTPSSVTLGEALTPDSAVITHGDTTFIAYSHNAAAFDRATRLVLDDKPLMVAGGADGDPDFDLTHTEDVRLLRDGRLAVMLTNDRALLIFDTRGRGQHRWGRQGQGPGEFMMPMAILQGRGDTLLIPDLANARINVLLPDKGVVQTRAASALMSPMSGGIVGPLHGGQLFVANFTRVPESVDDTVTRSMATVSTFAPDSSLVEVFRVPDLDVRRVATRYRGRPAFGTTIDRFTRRGYLVALDSVLVTSHTGTHSFDVRNESGLLLSRIAVQQPRRFVSPELREYFFRNELERFSTPASERMVDRAESERLARERPAADSLPPLHRKFSTGDQTIWLVDVMLPTDSSWSATAFRHNGTMLGRLMVPGTGQPIAFGDGVVVERVTDNDDVVSLVVRRILPETKR